MTCSKCVTIILLVLSSLKYAIAQLPQNTELVKLDRKYSKCHGIDIREITISQIQNYFSAGQLNSTQLTECYLQRTTQMDKVLKSVIEVNPEALKQAIKSDEKRKAGRIKGPLHGIPILLKDNICTADKMHTTAGSLALANLRCKKDASVIVALRRAGAIILGKTNLSEFAGFRGTNLHDGWSSRGGQTKNPYNMNAKPGGSSSGSAVGVAANLAVVSVGTDTGGSIVYPGGLNSLFALRPTQGMVSMKGIIPLNQNQDTVGPMARTVADLAILLNGMVRSKNQRKRYPTSYVPLAKDQPFRIGVPVFPFYSLDVISSQELTYELPILQSKFGRLKKSSQFKMKSTTAPTGLWLNVSLNSVYEISHTADFKHGISEFLETEVYYGGNATNFGKLKSLKDIVQFYHQNPSPEGYDIVWLEKALNSLGIDNEEYQKFGKGNREAARAVLDAAFWRNNAKQSFDALVTPSEGEHIRIKDKRFSEFPILGFSIAAIAGYPCINIPVGVQRTGTPFGISLIGKPYSEEKLLQIAYLAENILKGRRPPKFYE